MTRAWSLTNIIVGKSGDRCEGVYCFWETMVMVELYAVTLGATHQLISHCKGVGTLDLLSLKIPGF